MTNKYHLREFHGDCPHGGGRCIPCNIAWHEREAERAQSNADHHANMASGIRAQQKAEASDCLAKERG